MRRTKGLVWWCVGAAAVLMAVPLTRADEPAETPPPGVEQILPRGGIPAVFAPQMIPAAEAEIPGDAWVLGVLVDGEARAYDLNLLNDHEVVNDAVGERTFAAVW